MRLEHVSMGRLHTWSFTGTPSTLMRFVTNSTPTVLSKSSQKSLLWNRAIRLLFPTPLFPKRITFFVETKRQARR